MWYPPRRTQPSSRFFSLISEPSPFLGLVVDLDERDADVVALIVDLLHAAEEGEVVVVMLLLLIVVIVGVLEEDHGQVVVALDQHLQDRRGYFLHIGGLEKVVALNIQFPWAQGINLSLPI